MRFEGTRYRPSTQTPEFFERFLEHYNLVTRWLLSFNENRFNFKDDVKSTPLKVTLNHGVDNVIPHSLKYTPSAIHIEGRVEMFIVKSRDADSIRITPLLRTSMLIDPPLGQLAQRFQLADTTLFSEGDSVLIGGQVRTIRSIQGNVVVLDTSVLCGKTYVMSLASETVQMLIY